MKKPKPTIKLREAPTFREGDQKAWFFLKYDDPSYCNLEMRWVVLQRISANGSPWWGVRSMFPDTHENGIDGITYELKLAKEAIEMLKQKLLSSPPPNKRDYE